MFLENPSHSILSSSEVERERHGTAYRRVRLVLPHPSIWASAPLLRRFRPTQDAEKYNELCDLILRCFWRSPGHRQAHQAAKERDGAPGQVGWLGGQPQVGEALDQRDLGFKASQRRAQAVGGNVPQGEIRGS